MVGARYGLRTAPPSGSIVGKDAGRPLAAAFDLTRSASAGWARPRSPSIIGGVFVMWPPATQRRGGRKGLSPSLPHALLHARLHSAQHVA